MKKYKKSSLKYKNRAWVIVFTNILQLVIISVIIYISIIVSDKMVQNKGGDKFGYT